MRKALVAALLAVAVAAHATEFETRCAAIAAAGGRETDAARLHRLFDVVWQHTLEDHPEFATRVGAAGFDARWTDDSADAIARRRQELDAPAAALASIDRAALGAPDRLNHDLFRWDLDEARAARRFPHELLAVSQLHGVQHEAVRTLAMTPATTPAEYARLLERLAALPRVVADTRALLARGLERGVTPPRVVLEAVPEQIDRLLPVAPLESPLLQRFAHLPGDMPAREQARLRRHAEATYRDEVAPAFRDLRRFLTDTYIPAARTTTAMTALPDGEAWYAHTVGAATTTTLGPREIHAIGEAEVARIRRAMEEVRLQSGFADDLAAFVHFLRTDARFVYADAAALLAGYRDVAKRADPELVKLFGRLPRLPYGVTAVPAHTERSQPAAYYERGSLAAGRPAYFFANTYDLPSRPRWQMEALTLHEAVPGHHLQTALAEELEGVPEFRRWTDYTAFVEGWALYAEGLGDAMGLYTDPYARFGRLSLEMWRAVRLVVDTGLHALGWTRERAIAYLVEQTGKSTHDATVEVDRYLAWPGQALGYKIGELRIRELRREAERRLGPRFDVRAFHDAVLADGALPLDILDARIRGWIATRASEGR